MSARLSGLVDIVTGAGRGLGRGMAFGLARLGAMVIGPANFASDFDNLKPADALPGALLALMATCGDPPTAMRLSGLAQGAGGVHILVNNAGLTLTYRRAAPPKFREASDEIVRNVMDANFVAAQHCYRRCADAFDRRYVEGVARPKILAIAIHSCISGQPFRINSLERVYEYIARFSGVVHWNGAEIYE